MNKYLHVLLPLLALTLALALPASAHNGVDDEPHHGGVVKAWQDMHFEAAVLPTGGVQVYFSDAMGEPMPASAISQVQVEVARPGQKTEYIDLAIDPTGVFWIGKSQPLAEPKSVMRVGFVTRGKSALVEVPGERLIAASKKPPAKKSVGHAHEH
jgi:hypothetical protein